MKSYLIDTNVMVRFIVGEPEDQFEQVKALFGRADVGQVSLVLLPLVVAETVYVLTSFYGHSAKVVAAALGKVIEIPALRVIDEAIVLDALDRFASTRVDFMDAYLAAAARTHEFGVATFDQDFKKFTDVERLSWDI